MFDAYRAYRLERGLQWLGDAPNCYAIVQRLRRRGIRGVRWSPAYCPTALYLARRAGLMTALTVLTDKVKWEGLEWTLSPTLREFTRRFDEGRYPSLEM